MDAKKTGLFIAEKRKEKNLTQQDLADKLHLSNRTISKWECGKGMPDSAVMMELCEALDISANELLSGEHIANEEYKAKADKNIIALMNVPKNTYKQSLLSAVFGLLSELILVLFLLVCVWANVMDGTSIHDFMDLPAILIIVGTTAIILMITGLAKSFIRALKISCGFRLDISIEEMEGCVASIKVVMLSAFFAGFTLFVASVIGTLVNVMPNSAGAIYVGIAVSLLGPLYGAIICVIMIPVLGRLYKVKSETWEKD